MSTASIPFLYGLSTFSCFRDMDCLTAVNAAQIDNATIESTAYQLTVCCHTRSAPWPYVPLLTPIQEDVVILALAPLTPRSPLLTVYISCLW